MTQVCLTTYHFPSINQQVFSTLTPITSNLFVPQKFSSELCSSTLRCHYFPLTPISPNTLLHYNSVTFEAVGTATCYRLGGPGIESRFGARFSAPVQTGPEAHPASCTMNTGSFPGVKRQRRGVDHPPHLAPRLRKE